MKALGLTIPAAVLARADESSNDVPASVRCWHPVLLAAPLTVHAQQTARIARIGRLGLTHAGQPWIS